MHRRQGGLDPILARLGLLPGLIGPNLALPRLRLAAHTFALPAAALRFGLAACWPLFRLSERGLR